MKRTLLLALVAIGLIWDASFAIGALYARRAFSENEALPLWLKNYDATVTINDQMAVTHVTHVFKNESSERLEGLFFFPLPQNAVVTELALWINGQRVVGDVMESDTARAIYEGIVRRKIDPALLEYMGDNIFKLSVFPIEPNGHEMSERKIEITYAELLPYDAGNIQYTFLMKSVDMSSKPVDRASIAMGLKTQNAITAITSPTHGVTDGLVIAKTSATEYRITYGQEQTSAEKDLALMYKLENSAYAITHLTYKPSPTSGIPFDEAGDDPYYLLWVTPPDSIAQSQIIPKNVVFVADVSSSMAGERMEQLRSSLTAMVATLNTIDRFNIIAFSTGTTLFKSDLVSAAEPATINAAKTFISQLGESGLTNMEDALKRALASSWIDTCMNAIVFFTDGKPTWPINSTADKIIDTVAAHNNGDIAIFTFGVGEEVEEGFLKLLARENNAFESLIGADDSISLVMESFMRKISYPLIKNITLNCGELNRYDFYPRTSPNLYAGTQFTQLGRFRNSGSFNVQCRGEVGSKQITFSRSLSFPAAEDNSPFVARMWASAKINDLLDEIAIYGENDELVNAVKLLSKKYDIITPYTSMLVVEPLRVMEDKRMPLAKSLKLTSSTPNPFRGSTTLRYAVPKLSQPQIVSLKIYDASGRLIRTLVNEPTLGGNFVVAWNGQDQAGHTVAAGFYLAVLQVGDARQMLRMRLVN